MTSRSLPPITTEPVLRRARPGESEVLSELALASKASWGYSAAFLEACREELSVSPALLRDPCWAWVVADVDGRIAGYYGLELAGEFELEALFVAPEFLRRGIGRQLLNHARTLAADRGALHILIQGDPNAEAFYRAAGARHIGSRPSQSIPGRNLPLFELAV